MQSPSRTDHAALAALAVMVLVWAYSWIVMKQSTHYVGPFDFVALRYGIGTAVLFLTLFILRTPLKPPPWGPTLLVGLLQTGAFNGLVQWAVVQGGAGRVSLLAYTMPFWSILFAWWLLHERPGARQWLGIAAAVIGLLFVLAPWKGRGDWHSTLLAILGGCFWGLATVITKNAMERHHTSPITFTAWQMLVGTVALAIVALLVPSRPIVWAPELIFELFYAAVLASSLAWVLWTFVIARLPATIASLSSLGVPVTVILMAWVLLHERPSQSEFVGIILIVVGLFVVSRGKRGPQASKDEVREPVRLP